MLEPEIENNLEEILKTYDGMFGKQVLINLRNINRLSQSICIPITRNAKMFIAIVNLLERNKGIHDYIYAVIIQQVINIQHSTMMVVLIWIDTSIYWILMMGYWHIPNSRLKTSKNLLLNPK